MRPVRFLDEARTELLEHVSFYEERQKGLGDRLREGVQAATALAATHPELGSPWKLGTRRVFSKGFPFSIVYRIETAEVIVFAIAHFRRRPTYWRRRGDA